MLKPARGRAVIAIHVEEDGKLNYYDTQDEIVWVVKSRIGTRYRLGKLAPIASSKIHEDLVELADTEIAQRILDGTYNFP